MKNSLTEETVDLLTVGEVAKQLRCDDTTIRRWIKAGILAAVTLPRCGTRQAYRIHRSTLDDVLATRAGDIQQ